MSKLVPQLTVLFIHGWGGSNKSLTPLLEEVAVQLNLKNISSKLKNIELPGFGNTKLEREYTLEDYSQYVLKIITKNYNPESQLILIGHSFGGKIILNISIKGKYPKTKIILLDASGLEPKTRLKKKILNQIVKIISPVKYLLTVLRLESLEAFPRKVFYKFIVRTRDYENITDPTLKKTFLNLVNTHLAEEKISTIENSSLIIWGETDKATPLWMGDKLHSLLKNSNLVVLPNIGHGLPLKEPKKVGAIITEYITKS